MLITFKTLQQKIFKIEAQPADTVTDLKAKVAAERGEEFPAGHQKLIYNGKVLDDSKTLQESGVSESGFVVVMAAKPKAAVSTESSTSAAQPANGPVTAAPKSNTSESTAVASGTSTTAATSQSQSVSSSQQAGTEDALVTGSALEKTVADIVGMGFERSEVLVALRAAYNNPARAVDYLLNPDTMPRQQSSAGASDGALHETPAGTGQLTSEAAEDALDALSRTAQFRQMRSVLQNNPDMLPAILEQIGRSDQQLLQLISANQQRFLELLNGPEAEGADDVETETETETEGGAEIDAEGEMEGDIDGDDDDIAIGAAPAGGRSGGFIQVSSQEKEAIERLKGLGFPEHLVIQAYFACDKNEEAAANFLLSEQLEDDDFRG